jgi:hypothetical protein
MLHEGRTKGHSSEGTNRVSQMGWHSLGHGAITALTWQLKQSKMRRLVLSRAAPWATGCLPSSMMHKTKAPKSSRQFLISPRCADCCSSRGGCWLECGAGGFLRLATRSLRRYSTCLTLLLPFWWCLWMPPRFVPSYCAVAMRCRHSPMRFNADSCCDSRPIRRATRSSCERSGATAGLQALGQSLPVVPRVGAACRRWGSHSGYGVCHTVRKLAVARPRHCCRSVVVRLDTRASYVFPHELLESRQIPHEVTHHACRVSRRSGTQCLHVSATTTCNCSSATRTERGSMSICRNRPSRSDRRCNIAGQSGTQLLRPQHIIVSPISVYSRRVLWCF